MRHSNHEEFLGIDVGDKRVGIARGSTAARIAQPLKTVAAQEAIDEIAALAKEHQASGIVVGLPRNLNGEDTLQTKSVRSWVREARGQINQPFYWQDEALTSAAAEHQQPAAEGIDAAAAAVILQDFLDAPAEPRVRC